MLIDVRCVPSSTVQRAIPRSFESPATSVRSSRTVAKEMHAFTCLEMGNNISFLVSFLPLFFLSVEARHRAKEWFFVHSSKMYESEVEKSCVREAAV